MLGVSENWLRDKARAREIPHTMPGGSYKFTPEHLAEILRQYERRPELPPALAPRAPARRWCCAPASRRG
jgi:hypothetical protein